MNFLEAIFSWVFGDGDPNADYDRRRWQAAGRYIQSRGGTVVAEELAPFLDLKPGQLASDRGRLTGERAGLGWAGHCGAVDRAAVCGGAVQAAIGQRLPRPHPPASCNAPPASLCS